MFTTKAGKPALPTCAVLFVDLLGVRAMNRDRKVASHLRRLSAAVTRNFRDFLEPGSPWPAAFFSDSLVIAAPVVEGDKPDAIGGLVLQAAHLQLNLIAEGFFLRGGLSLGRFYIRDGIIFGPALVDAYELEDQVAVHPRIVLSAAACDAEAAFVAAGDGDASSHDTLLMRDDDGAVFVNYLAVVLDEFDPRELLRWHRQIIVDQLAAHRGKRRQWEKYRWAGEYHNAFAKSYFASTRTLRIQQQHLTWTFSSFS